MEKNHRSPMLHQGRNLRNPTGEALWRKYDPKNDLQSGLGQGDYSQAMLQITVGGYSS